MASYFGLSTDEPAEDSERRVAASLKTLPEGWTVLHHISWQSKREGRQGDGEADFLVFHPRKGMLVIEVKGGGIEIENGRWTTTDRHGKRHQIKNPYEQATASKHALLGYLREHGLKTRYRIGHAVAFPHMMHLPTVGPAGQEAISITRHQLDGIEAAIDRCFNYWGLQADLSPEDVAQIISLLAPTTSVMPSLLGESSYAEAQLIVLSAEQIEAFSNLRARRGGLILGGAGTGKTVLAIARAQQLARDGFRTLLVCYNELLGEHLTARVHCPPMLTASTFHSLCLREARQARLSVPARKPPDWWETAAPNLLIEACVINDTTYDAVVVDEAQDFSQLWLEALKCLISSDNNAPFFLFADPFQDIWQRDWDSGLEQPFVWKLTRNMRNTRPIAQRVAAAIATECKDRGTPGPNPIWRSAAGGPCENDVIAAVELLLDEGFGRADIVVLCEQPALVVRLRERTVGGFSFGQWGGRGIAVETISRFKGLESQAAVVVLAGNSRKELVTQAYIGMSRARSLLLVIGNEADKRTLNWVTTPQ